MGLFVLYSLFPVMDRAFTWDAREFMKLVIETLSHRFGGMVLL